MNLAPWITRLTDEVPALRIVEGVAEYAALAKSQMVPRAFPAAYVIPVSETPSRNELATTALQQHVVERVAIAWCFRNLSDPRGAQAQIDLEAVRVGAFPKLLNWTPAAGYEPVQFAGGELLTFDDQVIWWQDGFTTAFDWRVLA